MKNRLLLLFLPLSLLLGGCTSFGPDRLPKSSFNYSAGIGESWKSQMLLNIVKLRYGDVPVFLQVQSVIDQHNFTAGINTQANWTDMLEGAAITPWSGLFGGNASYSTSPTVTYGPMTGEDFGKTLMSPLSVPATFSLLQSGYPPELIFRMATHSINGRQNKFGLSDKSAVVDQTFYRILDLINMLEVKHSLAIVVNKSDDPKDQDTVTLSFLLPIDEDSRAKQIELRSLLSLDPQTMDFPIIYGSQAPADHKQIAILTRSILDVLTDLSAYIDVPPQHVKEQRVIEANVPTSATVGRKLFPLVNIYSGDNKPDDAFVAVPYRDTWYWIDDKEIFSKYTFSFLMFMFTLVDTGSDSASPMLVLPAGK